MKKVFVTLALSLFVAAGAFAGNIKSSSVPAIVKSYIEQTYPPVETVEWNYDEKGNYYNAQFKIDGANYDLNISPKGKLISSISQIATDQLPEAARAYIGKQFPGFKIKEARKLFRRGMTTYEADINGQNSDQTLTFSEIGNILDREL